MPAAFGMVSAHDCCIARLLEIIRLVPRQLRTVDHTLNVRMSLAYDFTQYNLWS